MANASGSGSRLPWARFLIEGTLIVASILLAFGIDAWGDERSRKRDERAELESLLTELEGNLGEFRTRANQQRAVTRVTAALLRQLQGTRPGATLEVADTLLMVMLLAPTSDPASGGVESIIGSGRIAQVEDLELRRLITAWPKEWADLHEDEVLQLQLVEERLIPFLVDEGVDLADVLAMRAALAVRQMSQEARTGTTLLTSSVQLRTMLAWRHSNSRIGEGEFAVFLSFQEGLLAALRRYLE